MNKMKFNRSLLAALLISTFGISNSYSRNVADSTSGNYLVSLPSSSADSNAVDVSSGYTGLHSLQIPVGKFAVNYKGTACTTGTMSVDFEFITSFEDYGGKIAQGLSSDTSFPGYTVYSSAFWQINGRNVGSNLVGYWSQGSTGESSSPTSGRTYTNKGFTTNVDVCPGSNVYNITSHTICPIGLNSMYWSCTYGKPFAVIHFKVN